MSLPMMNVMTTGPALVASAGPVMVAGVALLAQVTAARTALLDRVMVARMVMVVQVRVAPPDRVVVMGATLPDREMAVRVTITTVQAVTPPLPPAHRRPLRHRVNSLGPARSASRGASISPCR
jgi:hypothetical protein